MLGYHRRFISFLKKGCPKCYWWTLYDSWAALAHYKNLHQSQHCHCNCQFVIAAVNKIKYKPHNNKIFENLYNANGETYNNNLLLTYGGSLVIHRFLLKKGLFPSWSRVWISCIKGNFDKLKNKYCLSDRFVITIRN